ncbi:YdcF family protein [Sneathiella marina]|uniref:YdcF family protein n=1 Tax=Sneathiella marina TaxID=2950108 RepID=A0ABY4W1I4_9PROT|nr:YdcF family protein [Sneathiella marina]USG61070.1 YdcF family protein [Sneathiella marina]
MSLIFKSLIKVIFICGCFWLGGFLTFIHDIQITAPSLPQKVDGIVVLTGTPNRLKAGFDLLKEEPGARLLVSGVNAKVTRETLRQATGQSSSLMDCCVDLGRIARNTEGNAEETALWAKNHNIKEVLVVTSAYHMPRSLVELRRKMPDTALFAYPVKSATLDLQAWWTNLRTFVIVGGEFNKYVFSLIRSRLEIADKEEVRS